MKIISENISYNTQGNQLNGSLSWDQEIEGKRPGVIVFPEWWGVDNYILERTKQISELGYLALAVDMYGNG